MTSVGARSESSALVVLTQEELLHHIGGFMSGVPFIVGDFAFQEARRRDRERWKRVREGSTPETSLYPQPRGYLPQLAIIRDDVPMLERLLRVSSQSEHARNPRLEFHEVVRCAVMFDRLDALRWLQKHLNLADYPYEGNLLNYAMNYSGDAKVMDWLHDNVPRSIIADNVWSCNPRRHEADGPRRCQKNQYAMILQRKARKVEGGLFARLFGGDGSRRETTSLCSRDVSVVHRTSASASHPELMV
ncbi:hypothetical protein PHYBOEH_004110 [Phytophthora boehmeriae]|uniref:Uncharacterized protein n=1 Tax=Phytophthora boehmeriae TaxID=109152 RepID=A0A8T1WTK2_9STRA|nr:hypothetical protein PHYBOEH_004110 [Phytophthora boehmeriae]